MASIHFHREPDRAYVVPGSTDIGQPPIMEGGPLFDLVITHLCRCFPEDYILPSTSQTPTIVPPVNEYGSKKVVTAPDLWDLDHPPTGWVPKRREEVHDRTSAPPSPPPSITSTRGGYPCPNFDYKSIFHQLVGHPSAGRRSSWRIALTTWKIGGNPWKTFGRLPLHLE